MIEFLPDNPFQDFLNLNKIHRNIAHGYDELKQNKRDLEIIYGTSILPFIGSENSYLDANGDPVKIDPKNNPYSKSDTFSDDMIGGNDRYINIIHNL